MFCVLRTQLQGRRSHRGRAGGRGRLLVLLRFRNSSSLHEVSEPGGKISHHPCGSQVKGPLEVLLIIEHPDVDLEPDETSTSTAQDGSHLLPRPSTLFKLKDTGTPLGSNRGRTWMPRSVRCLNRDFLISKLQERENNAHVREVRETGRRTSVC